MALNNTLKRTGLPAAPQIGGFRKRLPKTPVGKLYPSKSQTAYSAWTRSKGNA